MFKITYSNLLRKIVLDICLNGKTWQRVVGENAIHAFLNNNRYLISNEMHGQILDDMLSVQ